jgi:hypothetical protein
MLPDGQRRPKVLRPDNIAAIEHSLNGGKPEHLGLCARRGSAKQARQSFAQL